MENQDQAQVVGQNISSAPEVAQAAPEATPELNIVDLQNIRAIIDTAARRGAFSAQEMSGVGGVFDRLNTFLAAVAPPAQPPAEQKPAE